MDKVKLFDDVDAAVLHLTAAQASEYLQRGDQFVSEIKESLFSYEWRAVVISGGLSELLRSNDTSRVLSWIGNLVARDCPVLFADVGGEDLVYILGEAFKAHSGGV